jgi:flagellar basal body P-ring protein FlgI
MEVLKRSGILLGDIDELKNSRTVALVMVECRVPESGARTHDRFDARVSVLHSAKSLRGGRLFVAMLRGPYANGVQTPVALAEGNLEIEDAERPTTAVVRAGAQILRDIRPEKIGTASFTLVLRPHFSGWAAATQVASTITDEIYGKTKPELVGLPPIATALDDRTVRVDIPESERANPSAFIADVIGTEINTTLLRLPPQVICNVRRGAIVVTGDVEISPAVIRQKDLVITTTLPPPVPTPFNPVTETRAWTDIATAPRDSEKARLADLLAAFNQLNIPVEEQVLVLSMLERAGKLHGRLIIE